MPESHKQLDHPDEFTVKDDKTACETPISSPERETHKGDSCQEQFDASEQVTDSEDTNDYSNWPLSEIPEPCKNDVLFGRGGGTNHHDGNKRYRRMVDKRKVDYVNSKRLDKPLIALDIIREWRAQKPPGRFLKLDEATGLWEDVGDRKAREKTSQALREKAPQLRKQQDESDSDEVEPIQLKNTRFEEPASKAKAKKSLGKGTLARDHSLGVDYVKEGEIVSVKGFSWESDDETDAIDNTSPPSVERWTSSSLTHNNERINHTNYCFSHERSRPDYMQSSGPSNSNVRQPFSTPNVHDGWHASVPYQVPQYAYSDEKLQESWAQRRYPVQESRYNRQIRSAEHDHRVGPMQEWYTTAGFPDHSDLTPHFSDNSKQLDPRYTNSYNHNKNHPHDPYSAPSHRWHSPDARVAEQPASIGSSAVWNDIEGFSRSRYEHDVMYTHSHENQIRTSPLARPDHASHTLQPIPRPTTVKRDTSNQNETTVTKPTGIKKSNRQRSSEYLTISDFEVSKLGNHMRQTSIGEVVSKPKSLSSSDRVQTIDAFELGMDGESSVLDSTLSATRPSTLKSDNRMLSIPYEDVEAILYGHGRPESLMQSDRLPTLGSIDSSDVTAL